MAQPPRPAARSLAQARTELLAAVSPLAEQETCPLLEAGGRVLAAPLLAPRDVPGFAAAVMDGYALQAASGEPGAWLPVAGASAAGVPYGGTVPPGHVVRISTGAMLPEGTDAVVPQEQVQQRGAAVQLSAVATRGQWVRAASAEAARGDELVPAGHRLRRADIARAAGCGLVTARLWRQPRIALLTTGAELRDAGEPLTPGLVHDSNGPLLHLLLEALGYQLTAQQRVDDDPEHLKQALLQLAGQADVLISTGGVSVGAVDHVRPLLEQLGQLQFWRIAMKPGRPFTTGTLAGCRFFGLPGNPVSAAVTFLQLVWPTLQALEGATPEPWPRLRVALAEPLLRRAGCAELIRARLETDAAGAPLARVCGAQDSARLGSLSGADLLLELDAETSALPAGHQVMAQLLRMPVL